MPCRSRFVPNTYPLCAFHTAVAHIFKVNIQSHHTGRINSTESGSTLCLRLYGDTTVEIGSVGKMLDILESVNNIPPPPPPSPEKSKRVIFLGGS